MKFFGIHSISGLCYLKVRVATWRYQRGSRSLALSLAMEGLPDVEQTPIIECNQRGDVSIDECTEVPGIVEEVIAQLLKALRDDDTTTRLIENT